MALSLLVVVAGFLVATDVVVSTVVEEKSTDGHSGSRSLGVTVASDGDALNNIPVTVINEKTGSQVFSGYTDSTGQIDITLPQGKYQVVVNGQQTKTVNLNNDQNVSFDIDSAERPKE